MTVRENLLSIEISVHAAEAMMTCLSKNEFELLIDSYGFHNV